MGQHGSLESPLAKLRRAKVHHFAFSSEVSGGLFYGKALRVETDSDGLEYVFRVPGVEINEDWPLQIGDCLFNLRAALDHLVYQLHVRHFRGRIPDDAAKQSEFPIRDELRRNDPWKEIRRLSIRQQTTIKHLQPYNRRNDEFKYVRTGLSAIHRLNNIDKHRKLHVVPLVVAGARLPSFPAKYGFERETYYGLPLVEDAVVERWTFTKPPPKVKMHPGILQQVVLDESFGPGTFNEVSFLLESLINAVETVIGKFAQYFASNA